MSVSQKRHNKSECSGCTVCEAACPVNCITIKQDKLGFAYPLVDEKKCVKCNICEKVCPLNDSTSILRLPQKAYAAWHSDSAVHSTSSSGGAAYALAQSVISAGGVAYGCTAEGTTIRHIRIDRTEDIKSFRDQNTFKATLREFPLK